MKLNKYLATLALALLGSAGAWATTLTSTDGYISISDSGGGTGTNILFDGDTGNFTNTVTTTANSGAGNYNVDFTSISTTLNGSKSNGQAVLDPVSTWTDLTIQGENAVFTELIFNMLANSTGTIDFTVGYENPVGVFNTASFSLGGNGSNFFDVVANPNALINYVTVDTTDTTFSELKQPRIDGLEADPAVPDNGATMVLLGVSVLSLEVLRRALLKKPARVA